MIRLKFNCALSFQGCVPQKPVNANPRLKINRGINFSCTNMFSPPYVLCSLNLVKLKTEGQAVQTENHNEKLTKLKSTC